MKRLFSLSLVCLLSWALSASAALYTYTFNSEFANGGVIPDGDLTGWEDTRTISDVPAGSTLSDLNVTLSVSGNYNGDLYGWLQHDTGFVVLLNREGKTASNPSGYSDTGFVIEFDDSPANSDIHFYQAFSPSYNGNGQLLGTWLSDARNVHPLSVLDTDARTATLESFTTLNPNGSWTLFLADVSSGEQSAITGWGLEIAAVPESSAMVPALLVLTGAVLRHWRTRRRG
jgi:subtilisin-like proprotein convertase family protein